MSNNQAPPFDRAEAERHLRWLRPQGPWTLTSIPPSRGNTATKTFFELTAAVSWAEARNEREGIYVSVARLRAAVASKASKADVKSVDFLWVDIDPPKNVAPTELDEWREGVTARAQVFSPRPSLIASSGGGLHIYWRLDHAMSGNDSAEMAAVEACNRWLARELDGDKACVNVDRILRLWGSRNLKPGRPQSLATVLFESDTIHPLRSFQQIEAGAFAYAATTSVAEVVPMPDVLPLVDVKSLRLAPSMLALIATGDNPDEPGRYPSRSEASWAVTCAMVRAGP